MSELMNAQRSEHEFRRRLLTGASALVLLTVVYGANASMAADQDTDRPTVWIELGGQLVHVDGQGDSFPVGFLTKYSGSSVLQGTTPLEAQNPPPFEFAEEGKISFQPESSDWVFSLAANFGRSSNFRHVDHQTNGVFYTKYKSGVVASHENIHGTDNFADTQVHRRESHAVLDFSVGKDVGFGLFGRGGSSTFSLGVRFAQFSSKTIFDARARPDLQFKYQTLTAYGFPGVIFKFPHFHTYHLTGQASRSFRGMGPSLSWNASAPLVGNSRDGEATLDWGINAAILFGKQRAHVQHQESGHYLPASARLNGEHYALVYQNTGGHSGVRSVTVPNVGGFAGASYRIENFKVSAGYRADLFFGAIDGGIDTRKSENVGFYGPFASVSVGLGG
jgi:hypothetical protein